jgi:hypothetical protein
MLLIGLYCKLTEREQLHHALAILLQSTVKGANVMETWPKHVACM